MNWRGLVILGTLVAFILLVGVLPGWLELRTDRRRRKLEIEYLASLDPRMREAMRRAGLDV